MVAGGEDISNGPTTLNGEIEILMNNHQFISNFRNIILAG